jgi:hypothetical protein
MKFVFSVVLVNSLLVVKHFKMYVSCYTEGQKSDNMLSITSLISQPRRPSLDPNFGNRY